MKGNLLDPCFVSEVILRIGLDPETPTVLDWVSQGEFTAPTARGHDAVFQLRPPSLNERETEACDALACPLSDTLVLK